MPLAGSESNLANKLKSAMKEAKTYEEAWEKFSDILLAHVVENALVIGTAPSGGGPIAEGKIQ